MNTMVCVNAAGAAINVWGAWWYLVTAEFWGVALGVAGACLCAAVAVVWFEPQ